MSPTTRTLTRDYILQALSQEKLGFKFGKPERIDDNSLFSVLSILRKTTTKRQYITFPETDQIIVTDSGVINRMTFKNTSNENIFIRSGTIFKGKTQARTLTRSSVIFPGQEVQLDVRCVHQTHGISKDAKVTFGGTIPLSMETKLYDAGFRPKDQMSYWNTVVDYTSHKSTPDTINTINGSIGITQLSSSADNDEIRANCCINENDTLPFIGHYSVDNGSSHDFMRRLSEPAVFRSMAHQALNNSSGSDNLLNAMDQMNSSLDDILARVKKHAFQVGMALLGVNGCQSIELYDVEESWAALHQDAVRRVGDKLTDKEPQMFDFNESKAIESVRWVLARNFKFNTIYKHTASGSEPDLEITGMDCETHFGEIVELDGKVVHLVIIKKA